MFVFMSIDVKNRYELNLSTVCSELVSMYNTPIYYPLAIWEHGFILKAAVSYLLSTYEKAKRWYSINLYHRFGMMFNVVFGATADAN